MFTIKQSVDINNCTLTINTSQSGDFEDVNTSSCYVEFIVNNTTTTDSSDFNLYNEEEPFTYKLPSDGKWIYYILYCEKIENVDTFEKNKLYWTGTGVNIGLANGTSEQITPLKLWEKIKSGLVAVETSYNIVSYCKLMRCVAQYQLSMFNTEVKTCGKTNVPGTCSNSTSADIKSQRDLLFIALWLIEHIEDEDKIENILEKLMTCGSLCDKLSSKYVDCGCANSTTPSNNSSDDKDDDEYWWEGM